MHSTTILPSGRAHVGQRRRSGVLSRVLIGALAGMALRSAPASPPSAPVEGRRTGAPTAAAAAPEARPPVIAESFAGRTAGSLPDRWAVSSTGWKGGVVVDEATDGRWIELVHERDAGMPFGNVMTWVDAAPLRGTRIELRSRMRTIGAGRGQMWLRVDRPNRAIGAFDNMDDRPVLAGEWTDASIEAEVAPDAIGIALGWISVAGTSTVQIDDVTLRVVGDAPVREMQQATPALALTDRSLRNLEAATRLFGLLRFFHPSDQVTGVSWWDLVALELVETAAPATDDADLVARLTGFVAPLAPTMKIWSVGVEPEPLLPPLPLAATRVRSMVHNGVGGLDGSISAGPYHSSVKDETLLRPVDGPRMSESFVTRSLVDGVMCRLPVEVFADEVGTLPHGETPERFTVTSPRMELVATNRATRLAGVVLAWTVFQHFYPYFDVVECDWDAALADALRAAAEDVDERAYLDTLAQLVAQLHDGHGSVYNPALLPQWTLPLHVSATARVADGGIVVVGGLALRDGTAAELADTVTPGDVVIAIDGQPIAALLADAGRSISAATDGWRRRVAISWVLRRVDDEPVLVRLQRLDGSEYEVTLRPIELSAVQWPQPSTTPPDGSEVAQGIVYFSLKGTDAAAFEAALPALSAAKGIIFDLRGYPAGAAMPALEHLISAPATSAQWRVPIVTRPDREAIEKWNTGGRWDLQPKTPHLDVPIAFLTDASAISYAESVMGIVEHYQLGEIVGSTTAGTNGNVNPFVLPGGYRVSWTGMQVLKHDGSRHHGVGIQPTVPVEPTREGIAAGRDEVLEKGVEVVQRAIAGRAAAPD